MLADVVKSVALSATKGKTIPYEAVFRATGVSRSDPDRFRLACLAFKDAVEKQMRENGSPAVIRVCRDGIRVLTDSEASRYTTKRFASHKRGLARVHHKAVEVNVANLTTDELTAHEHNLSVQARQLQAMRARKEPAVRPVEAA